jgi:glycosyltransferase involved in cell wall biosynthesis
MAEFDFHRLLVHPMVAVVGSGEGEIAPGIAYAARLANGERGYVLINPHWEITAHLPIIMHAVERAAHDFPNLAFEVLAASPEDERLVRDRGLAALTCNHNAFLDERQIYPEVNVAKIYDAVHNARIVPFKRHELAAKTRRLAIITGGHELEPAYANSILAGMHDLAYCNYTPGMRVFRPLSVERVRRILTQSCCGLALSAVEGSMYASAEYLLAGLPVVTTPSRGGRDVFFDSDYVTTVAESPDAVAEAVADLKARAIDPVMIRKRTLARMREHRWRLVKRLSELSGHDLFPLADQSMWLPQFRHQQRVRLKVDL